MNKAALVLGAVLILAVAVFVGGLGFAFYVAQNGGRTDEMVFRQEFGNVNVSSPVYGFSPPVPMYRALRAALESGGWNASSLCNMTVSVSLDYFEFTYNMTIVRENYTGQSFGSRMVCEVTQPAASYDPVVIQSGTNGTITYRYIWSITVNPSNGLFCIPPPGLYWVDAATAEIVSTGLIF